MSSAGPRAACGAGWEEGASSELLPTEAAGSGGEQGWVCVSEGTARATVFGDCEQSLQRLRLIGIQCGSAGSR